MNIPLLRWITPNYCTLKQPSGAQGTIGSVPLTAVDADELSKLCDLFREEIFHKAGKLDPKDVKGAE